MRLRITLCLTLILAASGANAQRAWIGDSQVSQINWHASSSRCGKSNKCLSIYFTPPYKHCAYVAIPINEPRIKSIEALAIVSFTTGKKFRVYGSVEHCTESAEISINDIGIH